MRGYIRKWRQLTLRDKIALISLAIKFIGLLS